MYRPYLFLDIEATGVDVTRVKLLQVAAIIDDGVTPIDELESFSVIVKNRVIDYGEPFGMGMNSWIFKEIHNGMMRKPTKYPVVTPKKAYDKLNEFIEKTSWLAMGYDEAQGIEPHAKIQLAGKNVGIYDKPVLQREADTGNCTYRSDLLQHRSIDIGPLYFTDFGYVPSIDEINKHLGRDEVTHDALQDCRDGIYAIRAKMRSHNG